MRSRRQSGIVKLRYNISYAKWLLVPGRNRTTDTVIFSHVLYELSYLCAGPAPSEAAVKGSLAMDPGLR